MRSSVERQSRVGIGQGCTCPLLQAAPTVPLAAAVLNKKNNFNASLKEEMTLARVPPAALKIGPLHPKM